MYVASSAKEEVERLQEPLREIGCEISASATVEDVCQDESAHTVLGLHLAAIDNASLVAARIGGETLREMFSSRKLRRVQASLRHFGVSDIWPELVNFMRVDPWPYWVLGFAFGINKPVMTYSFEQAEVSSEIGETVLAHVTSTGDFLDVVERFVSIEQSKDWERLGTIREDYRPGPVKGEEKENEETE